MNAVILGGAACVWDDLYRLECMIGRPWDGIVVAVNDAGWTYPNEPYDPELQSKGGYRAWLKAMHGIIDTAPRPIHHWASVHPSKFAAWIRMRSEYHPVEEDDITYWAHKKRGPVTRTITDHSGGSGLFARRVAHEVCDGRVIYCGVPLVTMPHIARSDSDRWNAWSSFRDHFQREKDEGKLHNVRSMSGWTRELLGAPDQRWLDQAKAA